MSRRDDLELMRFKLMAAMESAEPNVLPQLIGQLRAVVKELSELPAEKAESAIEQAKAKRAARRANLRAV